MNYDNGSGMYNPVGSSLKMPQFIPVPVWQYEKNRLKRLSAFSAWGILLFIALSAVYVGIFQGITAAISAASGNGRLTDFLASAEFLYVFELFYSVFVLGGAFLMLGAFYRKKGLIGELPFGKPLNTLYFPLIVIGGFGICLLGDIITAYLDSIFYAITDIEIAMPDLGDIPHSTAGIILFYLSTAVIPALIEEFAMRGLVMQPLRRYGDWFAVICSAIVFGLLHCNLAQIPFAFIAGLAIGYAVIVTESIWTGVIIHFLNNAFSVTGTIFADFYGIDSWQYKVFDIAFYLVIAVGIAFAVIVYKKLGIKKFRASPLVNSGRGYMQNTNPFSAVVSQKKLYSAFLLTFPMILALIAVCYETIIVLVSTSLLS